jgi:hypothetical protein
LALGALLPINDSGSHDGILDCCWRSNPKSPGTEAKEATMGGTSSQPVAAQAEQKGVFTLSEDLQGATIHWYDQSALFNCVLRSYHCLQLPLSSEQMAQEYNNEQVLKLFGKQMEKLGERKAENLKGAVEQKTKMKQHMEQFREQNKQIHQQLDQAIESFEDRFTDTANVVEYDAARLEKKYLDDLQTSKSDIPCFAERSSMAKCYTQNQNDPAVCDSFIEALTACANKTITTK